MSAFDAIEAQDAAVQTLRRSVRDDRVASAYLFEGPGGVGKQMAALALAREVVAASDPEVDRRIAAGRHPDVRLFEPRSEGSGNIPVELVRNEVLPLAQYAPFEAAAAFLIFPRADVAFPDSHPEAANALLKTLEEPKRGVHFVLTSERPDRLLPTIRSRCQRVTFGHLPPAVIDRILAARGIDEEQRPAAVALADGRADRALELAEGGTAAALLELALRLDEAVEHNRPGTLVDLAEELARSAQLALALETLATFYRDVACISLGLEQEQLAFRHAADRVRQRAETLDAARASSRVELLRETADALERNVNAEIAVDALLFRLRDAA